MVKQTDILKSIAVLAVIWQAVLNLIMKQPITPSERTLIILLFNLVKFSAPVFIFAICFDLSQIRQRNYGLHLRHKAKELLIPYVIWSTIYLLLNHQFNLLAYPLGTAAPHLWYTVMMFQFQLLMPILWLMFDYLKPNWIPLTLVLLLLLWLLNANFARSIWWLDRTFISYSLFAYLGVIAARYEAKWKRSLSNGKLAIITFFILTFVLINVSVDRQHITLSDITYLKPSMLLYNVAVILVLSLIPYRYSFFKWISTYAFRAYLAHYFCLNIVAYFLPPMPIILKLIFLFICTTLCSFGLVIGIEGLMLKRERTVTYHEIKSN